MHRTRPAAVAALALALTLAPLSAASLPAAAAAPHGGRPPGDAGARARPAAQSPLTPTPRSMSARTDRVTLTPTVTVVAGPGADRPALMVVERALRAAGAERVVRAERAGGTKGLTVYVDGAGAARALAELGAEGSAGLPAEGYALGIGADRRGVGTIALAGADARGTYYAAQSLRQLLPHRERPGQRVRGTVVRDWPGTALRGVIEGFYGTPWSHAARLDQLDFYGEHKMNLYVYSPKDDPYLREKWREPYPSQQLSQLKELTDRARARHVEFSYALSPGLSVCYSSPADLEALTDKFQSLWDIGVRTFAVPLDDISYTDWNCAADKEKFGTGGGAAGAAQAHLLNRVNRDFIATHPGARPLQMVPTEYYDVKPSPYKKALATQLDKNVLVEWTGIGVIAPTMSVAEAEAAREVFGHPILTWDNYPVNDYVTNRLLLGPFNGRQRGLPGRLAGITANPMIQPAASKIALFTVADYAWNDGAYDARTSWDAALRELTGGDGRTARALRAFADVNYGSLLNPKQAPELAATVEEFWKDGPRARNTASGHRLAAALRSLQEAPGVLRDRLADRGFVQDSGPWLDATRAWGAAARTALRMVVAARAGEQHQAWQLRQRLPELVRTATSYIYVDLNGKKIPVVVGDGVLDAFVDDAVAEHDRTLGAPGRPKGLTDLGSYQDNGISRMTDGDDSTCFWSGAAPRPGTYIGLDLRAERPLGDVTLSMGKSGSPRDFLQHGVLEYSADGRSWTRLARFDETAEVRATPPAGVRARYVRARVTQEQQNWLAVREFTVAAANGPQVSGEPAAAQGSALRLAADGDPGTAYRGSRAARPGEFLQVTPAGPRPAGSVTVLRPDAASGQRAEVQVRGANGQWRGVGELRGAYTRLPVTGDAARHGTGAVRLVWRGGTQAPVVSEVLVR